MQGNGESELFVLELEDGRLDMSNVFITGGTDAERLTPKLCGNIDSTPDFFKVVPSELFMSGDVMQRQEARKEVSSTPSRSMKPIGHKVATLMVARRAMYGRTWATHLQLEHVIFVRIKQKEPYLLDFKMTYCFNCAKQEFYRVECIPVVDEADIKSPLLRFQ